MGVDTGVALYAQSEPLQSLGVFAVVPRGEAVPACIAGLSVEHTRNPGADLWPHSPAAFVLRRGVRPLSYGRVCGVIPACGCGVEVIVFQRVNNHVRTIPSTLSCGGEL